MNAKIRFQLISIVSVVSLTLSASALAQTVFFDDFEDGSAVDGMPVTWESTGNEPASLTVEDGRLVVGGTRYAQAEVRGLGLADTSIRSQLKTREGDAIGVGVRYDPFQPAGFRSYYAYAQPSINEVGIGWGGNAVSVLDSTFFEMDSTDELIMQLDAIGDQISLWVWRPGEPMPSQPTASGTDTRVTRSGDIFVFIGSTDFPGTGPAIAEYEYVRVSIPEPSSGVLAIVIAVAMSLSFRKKEQVHQPRYGRYDRR